MRETLSQSPRGLVLFVDDEPENLRLFKLQFGFEYEVTTAASGEEALEILSQQRIDVVLTDERMAGLRGIELLARVFERWPETTRVIVSAYGDASRLLAAINRGHAHEYMLKPWDADELGACLERGVALAERHRRLAAQANLAEAMLEEQRHGWSFGTIVQAGPEGPLATVLAAARRAASSDATVLVLGETGTGKELVARLIHEDSKRAAGPFIRVNCAALAEGVLESELFGHEKGAFTGAAQMRRGRFELANGGTLFLDEIGDVPARVQVALLRVLQEREFERVGGNHTIKVDVRLVCATHRDLPALVRDGRFRADLFYRLNVIPLLVPPLRERPQDIPALVRHFISKHGRSRSCEISASALQALTAYPWPGNVRELENLVHRALVLAEGEELTLEHFWFSPVPPSTSAVPLSAREEARQLEADSIRRLLLSYGGNVSAAARASGVARTTFLDRARKHGCV